MCVANNRDVDVTSFFCCSPIYTLHDSKSVITDESIRRDSAVSNGHKVASVWGMCPYNILSNVWYQCCTAFFIVFDFLNLKQKKMNIVFLTQQRQFKIVIYHNSCQLIIFDKSKVIIQMNNNFKLSLLCQKYNIHLFLFQIQRIKNHKNRSDATLMPNIW